MFQPMGLLFASNINVVRVIGLVTAVALLGIAMAGLNWEARVSR